MRSTKDTLQLPQAPTQRRDSKIYTEFEIQHGSEARNRYKDIIAPVKTTQILNIHATNPKAAKRGSIMTPTGILAETKSQIPPLFVLAVGDVLAELKIHSLGMRTTASTIDYLPSAKKPPSIKFKSGKSGVCGDVIAVKDQFMTMRDADGKIVPLIQNQKYKPTLNDDIGKMQYPIPLEKIILGLNRNPPDFILTNQAAVQSSGILEFKLNCDDPAISQITYRVNLNATDNLLPLETAKNRESPAVSMQPEWWNNQWGEFKDRVQQGHKLWSQENPAGQFEPYEVYGRKDGKGNMLLVTGDQDVHSTPRSDGFELGELATKPIDTHQANGAKVLEEKVMEIHSKITMQMIYEKQMNFNAHITYLKENISNQEELTSLIKSETDKHNAEGASFVNNRNIMLDDFMENSKGYLEDLGEMTAFEAYVAIRINLKQIELNDQYRIDPHTVMSRLNQVRVTPSVGLDHILKNGLDVDLNPEWFEAGQNPEGCAQHVNSQLAKNRFVSDEILLKYMQHLESKQASTYEKTNSNLPAVIIGSRDPNYSNLAIETAKKSVELLQQGHATEVYVIDIKNKSHKLDAESKIDARQIKDVLIVTTENNQKSVLHINENRISSNLSGEKGQEHVKLILKNASIPHDSLRLMQSAPDDTKSSNIAIKQEAEVQTSFLKHH